MEKSKAVAPSMDINPYTAPNVSTNEGEQDWSDSIWSLGSDHEHSDRSNLEENNQSGTGGNRLIKEPKEENRSSSPGIPLSPAKTVQIRKKYSSTRSPMRIAQKQRSLEERSLNTFCSRPQISTSRSSDPCPDEKMRRPFFGLDCYELLRRNSMPVRLKTRPNPQELPRARLERRPESWEHSVPVSSAINRARLILLRTSLSEDQPSQPSPEVWRTKPPRPPMLSTQGTESVPVGHVAEIVNRVESQLLQLEGGERIPAGSQFASRSSMDTGDRDGSLSTQQSVGHPTASARHNSETLVNKRLLLVDKAREQPSESATDLAPVYELPQIRAHADFRKLSASNEPPKVTDHRRREIPSATTIQLHQEQASYSGQGERPEGCRRHVSATQPYEPFFARMTTSLAEQSRSRRNSDTKVTRTNFSTKFSTSNNFENPNTNSAELEKMAVVRTCHEGEHMKQQPRMPVVEEQIRTHNKQTESCNSSKGWLPESDSTFLEDPRFPNFPSLSSVLSAGSKAAVTAFSPPPNQIPPLLSSSLQRTCIHVSRLDPTTTVSQSHRITRALTLPTTTTYRQRTPLPPRLVDDSTSISDSSELHSSASHGPSVSLFELLHFCHLETVMLHSNLFAARLRPVWWADDPLTCLGLRVTNVRLRLPEAWILKVGSAHYAPPAGNVHAMATHPDSAFKPVTPRHNRGQPSVLLIEEVYQGLPAATVPELRVGQILVELNGVSLLSTVTHMDKLRLLRSTLLNVFRALDAGWCRGLALTVATPCKPVSRSDRGELAIQDVPEPSIMLPKFVELSIRRPPPPVPPRRRQQEQEEYNNPESDVSIQNSMTSSLLRADSSSSCSSCSSNQDRVLYGRSCR